MISTFLPTRLGRQGVTRRRLLATGAKGLAAASLGSVFGARRASAASQVIVRSLGGSIDEAARKAIWEPFTKATGIEVVAVPLVSAKFLAMAEARSTEVDVAHVGGLQALILGRKGLLDRIDYGSFARTNVEDIDRRLRDEQRIAHMAYSVVIGYSTEAFPVSRRPTSWADVWDTTRFPGPRTLSDIAVGFVDLEFALIADGVSFDRLYPIDVDRAFKSMSRIRPAVKKFWETGAVAEQMFAAKEVVLGSVGNARILSLMDKGAPVGIEWNQQMRNYDYYVILKGAPHREHAERFIDFALQPERQAEFATLSLWGPTNRRTFPLLAREVAKKMASNPEHDPYSFNVNDVWWADNRDLVRERWQQWLLQR